MKRNSDFVEAVETVLTAWVSPEPLTVELTGMREVGTRELRSLTGGLVLVSAADRESRRDTRKSLLNEFGVLVTVAAYVGDYSYPNIKKWVDLVDDMIEQIKAETLVSSIVFDPYRASAEAIEKGSFISQVTLGFQVTQ